MLRVAPKVTTHKKLYWQYKNPSLQEPFIRIKLREVMAASRARTGLRLTYPSLSEATGLSVATLQSLAVRSDYNPRLSTIAKLCVALGCSPGDLLELGSE
jgi:DNA-binding Xre family transcriptional regulator